MKKHRVRVCLAALALAASACTTPMPVDTAAIAPAAAPAPLPAPSPPPPPAPLAPPEILAKVPEAYRPLFGQVKAEDAQMASLKTQSPQRVFEFFTEQAVRQKPDGAAQLAAIYPKETSPQLKQQILEVMPLRGANATPEIRKFVTDVASSDPSPQMSMIAIGKLDSASQGDIIAALRRREQAATAAGDEATARKIRDQIDHYRYRDVTLPKYAYRAPPHFVAVPAKTKSIRVLAFGDFGTGSNEQIDTAKAMQAYNKKSPFTFGITLGDNFYGSGLDDPQHPRWKTQWEDLYSPMKITFYPTYGNHDVNGDSVAAELAYSKLSKSWNFPAPYYTYTAGAAQFFAIDTQRLTDDQLDWLDKELKASKAPWKIVYGHYQIYSATRGDNDAGQADLVHRLLPVLKRNHVDAYLCGHDHNLQELTVEDGVHFFVMGAGGAGLYDFDQGNYPRSQFRSKEHGFGVVEVTDKALTVSLVGLAGQTLRSTTVKH